MLQPCFYCLCFSSHKFLIYVIIVVVDVTTLIFRSLQSGTIQDDEDMSSIDSDEDSSEMEAIPPLPASALPENNGYK